MSPCRAPSKASRLSSPEDRPQSVEACDSLIAVVFYGAIVSLNWLLTRLGFESALVTIMNRAQRGDRLCAHSRPDQLAGHGAAEQGENGDTFERSARSGDSARAAIEKSTFAFMSAIEDKFSPMPKGTLPWGEGLKMMREGRPGHSSEMLSLEQQRRIDAHFAEELEQLGSDFPYAMLAGPPAGDVSAVATDGSLRPS